LFDKLKTAKMHGLYTLNVSSRDEPSGIWASLIDIDDIQCYSDMADGVLDV